VSEAHSDPPYLLHEDDHLLVVNKPAGLNTHAPDPFASEGIYDWLKNREPRWAQLAIIHRLDKETSGVIVFGKTKLANQSLTNQFAGRKVRKKYLFLTDRAVPDRELTVQSKIARAGDRYVSGSQGELAQTRFRIADRQSPIANRESPISNRQSPIASGRSPMGNSLSPIAHLKLVEVEPLTGRTHQIRVHAAENGFPILGDTLYGGSPFARVCLHAVELTLRHPAEDREITFRAPVDFESDARFALRTQLIDPSESDAFRIIHGASDGWPEWYVDRLGNFLLSQSGRELNVRQRSFLESTIIASSPLPFRISGVYHKHLNLQVRRTARDEVSPGLVAGQAAPERFLVRENGMTFELSFDEGYSIGLFLDQRDNRRRFLTKHIAAGFPLFEEQVHVGDSKPEVLNTFAYTCGFSVCAAKSGARTTSIDLSKKYLGWGQRHFTLNGIDPVNHDFIFGDIFNWFRRLARKGRKFDVIILDPPTFSQSKESGPFRIEKDYARLVSEALPLLKSRGILFASANAAGWESKEFSAVLEEAVHSCRRKILKSHYVPQPPDFPVSRAEPAYLKTRWLQLS
jgi:23S rRNA (cytosine1962-C5)-methyltransferase